MVIVLQLRLLLACWASVFLADADVKIKSSPFDAALKRLAWAGSSGFECDTKCKQACFSVSPEDAPQTGDSSNDRSDACVAGCGCGGGSDHVFAMLDNGEAYISTDGGQAWNDLKKQVPGYLQREPNQLRHVHTSHTDPRSVALLTNTSTSWISHDGGNSWKPLKLTTHTHGERRITAWRWHPSRKDWALAESKGPPEAKASVGSDKIKQSNSLAFYTQDGGISFKLLAENVDQCHWAVRPDGDSRRILLTRYTHEDTPGSPQEIYTSEDFFATKKVLLGKGAPAGGPIAAVRVLYHYNFIFAVVPEWGAAGESTGRNLQLWFFSEAAQKPSQSNPFRAAKWPRRAAPVHRRQLREMQVLHSAEDMAILYVPASNADLPWGHVFSCSYQSRELSPLLTDVRASEGFDKVEWQAVSGIDGAFIANRAVLIGRSSPDLAEKRFGAQEADAEDDLNQADAEEESTMDGNNREIAQGRAASGSRFMRRTYLSLDMGTAWQSLRAPEKSVSGEALPGCESGPSASTCILHLAKWESSFAAPGIILGVGNTGVRLSNNPEHYGVFLSRDAGITWRQILEGPHEVAILAHGDMLAAVNIKSPGSLLYSTDNGHQWTTVIVAANRDKGFAVEGIFTHSSRTELQAFLALSSEARPGVVLASLDLGDALKESCKLPGSAGSADSDFEKWSPSDSLEDHQASQRPSCVLGVRSSYVRRKPDRACKTGATKLPPLDLRKDTPCQCTAADWACDAGYHRAAYTADAPCELFEDSAPPNVTQLCINTFDEHVEVTRGYTRIPGNRCNGGIDLSPMREMCPGNTGISAALRGLFYSHRTPVYGALATVLVLSIIAVQRQGGAKGSRGYRKKYEDSRTGNHDDDDIERELLIDPTKL